MIVNMRRYLFIGVQEDLSGFFNRAQKKGFIEFIADSSRRTNTYPEHVGLILSALKILKKQRKVEPYAVIDINDAMKVSRRVIYLKKELERLETVQRHLQVEVARITPFGTFSPKEIEVIHGLSGYYLQFFCIKTVKKQNIIIPDEMISIGTDYEMNYYLSISKTMMLGHGMIEMYFDKSLNELKEEQALINQEYASYEEELKAFAGYIDFLQEQLTEHFNTYHLDFAKMGVSHHMDGALFAIEGWIPKNKVFELFNLLKGLGIHSEEITIGKKDRVPTCMMNKKTGKIGEDLVHIYDTPATNDRDPSKWVLWAFAFFFAVIVADAGYGLIYLIGAFLLDWKCLKVTGVMKRFIKLLKILSVNIIIWGVLTASYFGMDISPTNPVKKYSAIQALAVKKAEYHIQVKDDVYQDWIKEYPKLSQENSGIAFLEGGISIKDGKVKYRILDEFYDNILMEIALMIGVIHISLSLIRYLPRNFSGIGWIGFIVGAYLLFPDLLNATSLIHIMGWMTKSVSTAIGKQLLFGGICMAVLIASIRSRWSGLVELTRTVEIFADILSYLRLYALGLAGMILASTFNSLGEEIGFVIGVIIIVAGHIINIVIGAMGGIIHGLRLNFIEWYHYSFEGGGKLFKPLRLLKYK